MSYKSWSHSVSDDKGERTIRVRQVENGFVIDVDIYPNYNSKEAGSKDYECKTYISSKNPLEGLKNVVEKDKLGFTKSDLNQMEFLLANS